MSDNPPELNVVPYNPLAREHLAESVRRALLAGPCYDLGTLPSFNGAGVYAIYYHGDSPYYEPIARENKTGCNQPIYVGKAVPPGSRRGIAVGKPGRVLYNRLRQHADSIRQVSNPGTPGHLDIVDFKCRFLVVEEVWIPLIESLSITHFQPPWNGLVDGFGHHDQGKTRRQQGRSFWDTLHPGRAWAQPFQPNKLLAEVIRKRLEEYYRKPILQNRGRAQSGASGSVGGEEQTAVDEHVSETGHIDDDDLSPDLG